MAALSLHKGNEYMSVLTNVAPEKASIEFIVGCDPHVHIRAVEDNGNIFFKVTSLDAGTNVGDLDAIFFNFTDPELVGDIRLWAPDQTSHEFIDDGVNTLSSGEQLIGDFDAKIEFGTGDQGVEGEVLKTAFTIWGDRPLTLDDLDLESFAVVVDSEASPGLVLTYNDDVDVEHEMNDYKYGDWHPDGQGGWVYVGDDEPEAEPAAKTFTIEGDANVQVTLTELENGDMQVDLNVLEEGSIGDLRGLFFQLQDGTLADGLSVSGDDVTDYKFEEDGVNNLGGGVNTRGEISREVGKFDGGVEIGTSGAGRDDIQSTTFTLSHEDQALTYEDFEDQPFAVRLTSVGEDRDDSLKLLGYADFNDVTEICDDQYVLGMAEQDLQQQHATMEEPLPVVPLDENDPEQDAQDEDDEDQDQNDPWSWSWSWWWM